MSRLLLATQVEVQSAGAGAQAYTGLRHAAVTIYKEEGFSAFFKVRVLCFVA